ncbi:MAG: matrixin family metalloprotease, partial [Patescibacteria group bacterium]|nr:matrixin family metalloprotease [Patescibacteria group bacterium]
ILGAFVFAFQQPIKDLLTPYFLYNPCEKPITYTLGSFDDRFGLSREAFLSAIEEAEAVWEEPIGKELFIYEESGKLKVNLIYDYRQQATNKLESLGIVVKEDRASYDELKAKYEALSREYTRAKADYDARVALFTEKKDSYDQEVQYWNKKGGAPKKEYEQLQEEKTALQAELAEIQKLEVDLHEDVENINSLVVVLNRLVISLNLSVEKYNEIGASRGEEFTEGDYQEIGGKQEINIYEFSNRDKLVRVLAHEFGHALGLQHVEDPQSIMYRLNTSTNEKLTDDDLKELKARCGIK